MAIPAHAQDTGTAEHEFRGKGVELTVVVHDGSGEPIASPALVKVLRDGSLPSGQGETSRGQAIFVINATGDFTVIVKAPGFDEVQKDVSMQADGRAQVDVYLRGTSGASPLPGRPVLAPKAREAFDKTLQDLSADHLDDAQKHFKKAVQLAPAHPDVLYLQGLLFLKQSNWTQAQASLEKATQIDPSHAPAFAALGMALCDQGKYDAAILPLERALQLEKSPQSGSAWQTRWTLAKAYYHRELYDQALQMSQDALSASRGKAPEIALLVAQSLTAVGRYDDAAQTLRTFLRDFPQHHDAPTAQRWLSRLTSSGKLHSD